MAIAAKLADRKDPVAAAAGKRAYATPSGGHWIKEKIGRGEMIVLDDGSMWEIDRLDRIDSSLWLKLDAIAVVEASDGLPGFDYLLVNSDSEGKVHAKYMGKK